MGLVMLYPYFSLYINIVQANRIDDIKKAKLGHAKNMESVSILIQANFCKTVCLHTHTHIHIISNGYGTKEELLISVFFV